MGKNVYRFAGSLLVAVICQCAVTLAMGGKEITVLQIVPMILATFLLALWCQLHVKGRVLLGGTVAIVVVVTRQVLGDAGFAWLLWGGIAYTVGAVLYGIGSKKKWFHCVFHIFVVLGSALQMVCILGFVL